MTFNEEQRNKLIESAKGKTVESLEYVANGEYWVMNFTDGSETSFKFMAELV